ncbi:MAG TPA: Lsr2 family protein [Micromonosporaceae bacterium]
MRFAVRGVSLPSRVDDVETNAVHSLVSRTKVHAVPSRVDPAFGRAIVENSGRGPSMVKGKRVAKETLTRLIDDLDGSEAAETVTFGLDGFSYQIDLSTKNASKLRQALSSYVAHGTRLSAARAGATRAEDGRARAAATVDRDESRAIRAWAERKGYEVALRGRIKQEIVDAYRRSGGR